MSQIDGIKEQQQHSQYHEYWSPFYGAVGKCTHPQMNRSNATRTRPGWGDSQQIYLKGVATHNDHAIYNLTLGAQMKIF
jgi:hypothetical protein